MTGLRGTKIRTVEPGRATASGARLRYARVRALV
jgi:hypothetical protein